MSQWTHVNASIRYDKFAGMGQPTKENLGQMCNFEDKDISHWDTSNIPCGSEGSIKYTIIKTGGENIVASMVVNFTGDLRDYEDTDEIITYFNSITKDKMVRSGILEIDVEYKDTLILRYDYDKKSFTTVATIKNQ